MTQINELVSRELLGLIHWHMHSPGFFKGDFHSVFKKILSTCCRSQSQRFRTKGRRKRGSRAVMASRLLWLKVSHTALHAKRRNQSTFQHDPLTRSQKPCLVYLLMQGQNGGTLPLSPTRGFKNIGMRVSVACSQTLFTKEMTECERCLNLS
jgi:hypothetical protein